MKFDRNSYGTLALTWLSAMVLIVICLYFIPSFWIKIIPVSIILWFVIFISCFFRVPKRVKKGSDSILTSVADGQIVINEITYEKEFLKRDCRMISIYMNFFDVHANFWPISGEVTYYKYYPGKHFLAFKPKASEDNEHTCTCIRTPEGKDIFFKQIAGGFARRIVNYAKPGMTVCAGDQCGIIKFGSRIDIYLPCDAKVEVDMREVVRACETVIAQL